MMRFDAKRDGFAIPMAILLIGIITAGVVGAFARVESEQAVVDDRHRETDAYALAEAGLNQYFSMRRGLPRDTTLTLPGGEAEIHVELVREEVDKAALYAVRSTGRPFVSGRAAPASHDIVQLAWFRRGDMQVHSAWTSISGLLKNGNAGALSGYDKCGTEFMTGCVCQPAKAGVAVPTGEYDGKTNPVEGDPPILEMGSREQMADQINIDWDAIVNHDALSADYRIPPDAWPYAAFADTSFWPTIYIEGNTSLPSNGRGTLIVRGDLTLGGGDEWTGIVLVGGKITDNGQGHIRGAVVSGLNIKIGETVDASSRANGTKTYDYDSCAVTRAATEQSTLRPMRNTWMDNWAAY